MKPLRFCLMIGLLVASITSIGATIPDWQKSSKNVVDKEKQTEFATFHQTAPKMVVIGVSNQMLVFAQTATLTEVVSHQIAANIYALSDFTEYVPEIEVTVQNYNYLPEKTLPKILTKSVTRLPRDGVRYGSRKS